MNVQRGDVLKARFPHASGERGKRTPVVVSPGERYNHRLRPDPDTRGHPT